MLGEAPEVTEAIVAGLTVEDFRVRRVLPGTQTRQVSADRYEMDFNDPQAIRKVHQLLTGREGDVVGGLVNFLGLTPPYAHDGCVDADTAMKMAGWLFGVVKEFEEDLCVSAEQGGGFVLNLTGLGGQFGIGKPTAPSLAAAGTLGVCKSLRRECPQLRVKTVDVDRHAPPQLLAAQLIEEMQADDSRIEVGLNTRGRWGIALKNSPHPTKELVPLPMTADSVILVTGGAYGITAEIIKSLASDAPARFVIVGRSPLPVAEPAETRDLDTPELRKFLIQKMRAEGAAPAAIEKTLQRMLKDRQISGSLEAIAATGARVEYHAIDVRDAKVFGKLIDDVYDKYGRLNGVVHGAGVIEDKRIRDKTPASFENVFRTKVDSAMILAEKLRPESLKFLVFFSSISGRFGNAGQSDYSAANEFLNKLAVYLDHRWPGRVVSINWGPWDAGMVSGELRRLYESKGVHLIPVDEGVHFLKTELQMNGHGAPEVVISCSIDRISQLGLGG